LPYSESSGKFLIVGYGYVPLECQEKGAECDISICGRNTLDIFTSSLQDMWRFSITGHIGPLVDHFAHPTSGSQLFPTIMGGSGWDVFQSYQLVKTEIEEWFDNDSVLFSSSDDVIMVSLIVIRYIYYGRINEKHMTKSTLMLLYCPHSLTFGHSSFTTNLGGTIHSRKYVLWVGVGGMVGSFASLWLAFRLEWRGLQF
jgi:hypothetical protein